MKYMFYKNPKTNQTLHLVTVTHRLGAWKWAKNRLSSRIVLCEPFAKGCDKRFKGVQVLEESGHFCTDYAGGKYGFNNGLHYGDLAQAAANEFGDDKELVITHI